MRHEDLDEREYGVGATIFREGEMGSEMFIIQAGLVAITKKIGDNEVFLATLERGDFFGEMHLLEDGTRTATARALAPTRVVSIRSGQLLMKFRRDPTFAFEMLQHMCSRVQTLNEQFLQLLQINQAASDELEKLSARAEYMKRKSRN
jgi:CRP/FNR family cyclic AMP-dependent transcriptional regulator